jgi:hypothetical protein
LTPFFISIIFFQISCKKTADAQTTNYTLPPATRTSLGGVIVGNGLSITSNGTLSVTSSGGGITQFNKLLIYDGQKFATINYDGIVKNFIPVTLPAGRSFRGSTPNGCLSPDGTKLFFEAYENTGGTTWKYYIYACSLNGADLTLVSTSMNPASDLMSAY